MAIMASEARKGANMLRRTSLMMDTDGRGQSQTERGRLVSLDRDGFVVLEVNGKHLLIPKAGIDALVDIESRGSLVARAYRLPSLRHIAQIMPS